MFCKDRAPEVKKSGGPTLREGKHLNSLAYTAIPQGKGRNNEVLKKRKGNFNGGGGDYYTPLV